MHQLGISSIGLSLEKKIRKCDHACWGGHLREKQ